MPGRPGLGSLDRGAICPCGANWVLPPDTLGPGPGVPTGHCCPFDLNTEQPKGCEGGAAPRGPGNVRTQSPRGWGLHPSLGLPPTRPRRPTALWAWRSVPTYAGPSEEGHWPQQSLDQAPPGAGLRAGGVRLAALLPGVTAEIKTLGSSQALPPVTAPAQLPLGTTRREDSTRFLLRGGWPPPPGGEEGALAPEPVPLASSAALGALGAVFPVTPSQGVQLPGRGAGLRAPKGFPIIRRWNALTWGPRRL